MGASGGVYALLAAHLANVVLNYNHMELGLLRIFAVFAVGMSMQLVIKWTGKINVYYFYLCLASADVGFAVYDRYSNEPISYVAHLAGALAGLTIGLIVLKNFEQRLREQLLWWVALGVYAAFILFALLYNIFNWSNELNSKSWYNISLDYYSGIWMTKYFVIRFLS